MKLPAFKSALLCAAFLAVAHGPAHADVLIDNVEGLRIDEDGDLDRFTGLWLEDDGTIIEVLDKRDKRPERPDFLADMKGQIIVPGMIDAHLHVMGLGFGALTIDLSETGSLDEALALIAQFARENPGRPWILGRGWNQEKWGLGRFPTAQELDRAVSDRPVALERVDGHATWANSLALEAAGVTAETESPAGGRIERGADGVPSGVFVDAASSLIDKVVPEPRPLDRDVALQEAQRLLLSQGITAAADMGTTLADWQTFRRAGDTNQLRIRIMAYAAGIDAMEIIGGTGPTPWLYEDRLRLNGVKLYLDGALGSRGAWLKAPYSDDPGNSGLPLLSEAQLRNLMSRAAMENYQVAVHAIGDAANAEALSAIEELSESYRGDRRWRVEHAQIVSPEDIRRFGEHGIIASVQPVHQTSDRLMAEARLGPARLEGTYAWDALEEAGARLALGSDAPVESPNPFIGMAVAMTRVDGDGMPPGGWMPQERLSRMDAWRGFTSDAAFAGFAEGRFGRLVKGERADFIVIDRDISRARPEAIRETQVLETWVGGKQVYRREDR
ncbi:amidohydrolase family protein [Citromicrobium bathyomarinum]|uniref:amidohydrolase n=1 Tax=Citromicrobium bathyomarinum TaxID=72174 RepID=UPI00315B3DD3